MSSSVNRPPERGDGADDPRRIDPAPAGGRQADGQDTGQYTDSQFTDRQNLEGRFDDDTTGRHGGTDRRDSAGSATAAGPGPRSRDRNDEWSRGDRNEDRGGNPRADIGSAARIRDRDAADEDRSGGRDRDREVDENRRRTGTTERIVKERTRASRGIARTAAAVVALVFLVVGILGFVPGVTTGVDRLTLAGHDSGALLLGIFQVSVLHNVIHLAFGVVGLLMSRTAGAARTFLIGGGIIYLALWLLGLLFGHDTALNIVPVNDADNWLHLGLGVVMVLLGLLVGRRRVVSREIVG
ncbi:hypothetical protein GCM10011512_24000 [Tersicoccus solisilvae]|uniref:DUF4383 domain-containing protein n=1 Tax=Tersicoccus solisilvae TaxID=1882339 RepID=A0ABQ1PFG0_9MICC|nr:DUF4383 domain-containing protein [Tersicoccus solisilvae]GGC96184.1 hypothetical protein GCM10011512_24000 [Tersicoccus solisilvae]